MSIILPAPLNTFGVLAGSAITNSGPTAVTGNVGISPSALSSITGFPPGTSTGVILGPDPVTVSAQSQNVTAYTAAQGLSAGTTISGDQAGVTLSAPGTYTCAAGLSNTGVWTLDGTAGQQYVFQIVSTLIFGTGATLVLTGGLRPQDVIFAVGSSATIGVSAIIQGIILALTSISVNTSATVNGNLFAQNGAVTLLSNTVVNPGGAGSTGMIVTNEWPLPGGTINSSVLPLPATMRTHQQMTVLVTGDGGHFTFTVNHNFNLSTAQLTDGFPEVEFEPILAAGITAAPIVTTKTANTVVITNSAFTGQGLRVRIKRPWSPTE